LSWMDAVGGCAAAHKPYRRELGVLRWWRPQNRWKQVTALAMGWKCRKLWSYGIPGPALPPSVVPVETRRLSDLCACGKLWTDSVCGTVYQSSEHL